MQVDGGCRYVVSLAESGLAKRSGTGGTLVVVGFEAGQAIPAPTRAVMVFAYRFTVVLLVRWG